MGGLGCIDQVYKCVMNIVMNQSLLYCHRRAASIAPGSVNAAGLLAG